MSGAPNQQGSCHGPAVSQPFSADPFPNPATPQRVPYAPPVTQSGQPPPPCFAYQQVPPYNYQQAPPGNYPLHYGPPPTLYSQFPQPVFGGYHLPQPCPCHPWPYSPYSYVPYHPQQVHGYGPGPLPNHHQQNLQPNYSINVQQQTYQVYAPFPQWNTGQQRLPQPQSQSQLQPANAPSLGPVSHQDHGALAPTSSERSPKLLREPARPPTPEFQQPPSHVIPEAHVSQRSTTAPHSSQASPSPPPSRQPGTKRYHSEEEDNTQPRKRPTAANRRRNNRRDNARPDDPSGWDLIDSCSDISCPSPPWEPEDSPLPDDFVLAAACLETPSRSPTPELLTAEIEEWLRHETETPTTPDDFDPYDMYCTCGDTDGYDGDEDDSWIDTACQLSDGGVKMRNTWVPFLVKDQAGKVNAWGSVVNVKTSL